MNRLTVDKLDDDGVINLVGEILRLVAIEYECVIEKANIARRKRNRNDNDKRDMQRLEWFEKEYLNSPYFLTFLLNKDADCFKTYVKQRYISRTMTDRRFQMFGSY